MPVIRSLLGGEKVALAPDLQATWRKGRIDVSFSNGRGQAITYKLRGELYVFTSRVARPSTVKKHREGFLARRILERNRVTEIVGFRLTRAGGLELAMCCDIVLASEEAQIGDAHANFGVYPGAGGAAVLPRLIPHNVAKYLLFTGKTLSAAEMKTYGLVNEVFPADQLEQAATDLAQLIAQKSPIALQRMKEVANASMDKSRDAALEHEQVMLRKHERSFDMAEGLAAFSEKRPPEFQGR